LATHRIPHGLGLKKLEHGFWEIRVGLSYRVLFKMEAQILKIVQVGTHEEIRHYLRDI
jgi:mRNA-degrading endonuclease RelE of RelBE toxin-antitoxin system